MRAKREWSTSSVTGAIDKPLNHNDIFFRLFIIVGCAHLLIIFLLQLFWSQDYELITETTLAHQAKQAQPQIKAFLYTFPTLKKSLPQPLKPDKSKVSVKEGNQRVSNVVKLEVTNSAGIKQLTETINSSSSSSSSSAMKDEYKEDSKSKNGATHIIASTQNYLQRHREAALNSLIEQNAQQYFTSRSLSEMDGDMPRLELPKKNTWQMAETLDLELDPYRIVKKGGTCYRVVKTPTQINPHAENLGFPYRCDAGASSVSDRLIKAFNARKYGLPVR